MGLLTDIFVADSADAVQYETLMHARKLTPERFTRVQFNGLTDLEFGTLWAILANEPWALEKHQLEEVTPAGETWLFRFPPQLVDVLAAVEPSRAAEATARWAATEELRCKPADVKPVVDELVRLAQSAKSTGRGLFLWGSL